jgi:hypothetical protein
MKVTNPILSIKLRDQKWGYIESLFKITFDYKTLGYFGIDGKSFAK